MNVVYKNRNTWMLFTNEFPSYNQWAHIFTGYIDRWETLVANILVFQESRDN